MLGKYCYGETDDGSRIYTRGGRLHDAGRMGTARSDLAGVAA